MVLWDVLSLQLAGSVFDDRSTDVGRGDNLSEVLGLKVYALF